MALTPDEAVAVAADALLPAWMHEREKLDRIDRWARWDHEDPHRPKQATAEYRELSARAQAPWGALIVSSVAQTLYIEGYRRPDAPDDATAWNIWQANGMDSRQIAMNRATLTYGVSYGTSLPGRVALTGALMPVMRGVSPRNMIALYADPAGDEWPEVALSIRKVRGVFRIEVWDDEKVHHLRVSNPTSKPTWDSEEVHNSGVTPVVRYVNRFDLEGRSAGEVEPFIPLLGRIDQTAFDRLVVQRFASWVVRTIAGMSVVESAKATDSTVGEVKMRLRVEDMLTAEDPDTKFGSLPATPLDGFIKAEERDLTDLAAVSQTPAFELLGQMANMSAEALAAAKSSQTAKSEETKHVLGEAYEQHLRLAEHQAGNADGAADFRAQVRWADTSIRSLSQAVDALGKLAQMLGFPADLLWSKVPGITQTDVDEAKAKIEEGGGLEQLVRQLASAGQSQPLGVVG